MRVTRTENHINETVNKEQVATVLSKQSQGAKIPKDSYQKAFKGLAELSQRGVREVTYEHTPNPKKPEVKEQRTVSIQTALSELTKTETGKAVAIQGNLLKTFRKASDPNAKHLASLQLQQKAGDVLVRASGNKEVSEKEYTKAAQYLLELSEAGVSTISFEITPNPSKPLEKQQRSYSTLEAVSILLATEQGQKTLNNSKLHQKLASYCDAQFKFIARNFSPEAAEEIRSELNALSPKGDKTLFLQKFQRMAVAGQRAEILNQKLPDHPSQEAFERPSAVSYELATVWSPEEQQTLSRISTILHAKELAQKQVKAYEAEDQVPPSDLTLNIEQLEQIESRLGQELLQNVDTERKELTENLKELQAKRDTLESETLEHQQTSEAIKKLQVQLGHLLALEQLVNGGFEPARSLELLNGARAEEDAATLPELESAIAVLERHVSAEKSMQQLAMLLSETVETEKTTKQQMELLLDNFFIFEGTYISFPEALHKTGAISASECELLTKGLKEAVASSESIISSLAPTVDLRLPISERMEHFSRAFSPESFDSHQKSLLLLASKKQMCDEILGRARNNPKASVYFKSFETINSRMGPESSVIAPLQRACKYPLLLREAAKFGGAVSPEFGQNTREQINNVDRMLDSFNALMPKT